jgi:Putative peptidoglycan binding domain
MFRFSAGCTLALSVALLASPAFASQTHHAATAAHKHGAVRRASHRIGHRIAHPLGQRGIAPERAAEIQKALIRENYLTGSPSGQWDEQTQAAMQKFQGDHGWQTKLTPDSRAFSFAYRAINCCRLFLAAQLISEGLTPAHQLHSLLFYQHFGRAPA